MRVTGPPTQAAGPATWPRTHDPVQRGQLWLLLVLTVLTLGAWILTIYQATTMDMPMGVTVRGGMEPEAVPDSMDGMSMPSMSGMESAATTGMAGMNVDAWSWSGFTTFVVAWAVMMAAMMFPASAPMLLLYRAVAMRQMDRGVALVSTWIFGGGYLLVWVAIGIVTWLLVELGSELAGRLSDAARSTWGPIALGAVLVVAGVYQLTPLKTMCLNHCRTPLMFVTRHWRDGYRGALRMGAIHGVYCVGCCWALFAVLVATGVMSLAWMLLLTLVVFAEKVLPLGRRGSTAIGVAFAIVGVLVASGAAGLPWVA